jgi:hypothetical protein
MIIVAGLSALSPATMLPIPGKKMLARKQKSPKPLVPTFGTEPVLPGEGLRSLVSEKSAPEASAIFGCEAFAARRRSGSAAALHAGQIQLSQEIYQHSAETSEHVLSDIPTASGRKVGFRAGAPA